MQKPHDTPAHVCAEEGHVLIDGPGFAVAMTPECAADTSDRLLKAACDAAGARQIKPAMPSAG